MILPFSLLRWYAIHGPIAALRQSAFRKIARGYNGTQRTVTTQTNIHMHTRIGDPVDTAIALAGVFEPGLTGLISRLAPTLCSYIDVGCNIGYFTCLVRKLNETAPIVAIDANPKMIERAQHNAALNNFAAILWENIGVGETAGEMILHINDERPSLASFGAAADKQHSISTGQLREHRVLIEALPDIIKRSVIKDIGLMKIDIEGFEPALFRGLTPEFVDRIQRMVFEFSPSHMQRCGFPPDALSKLPWWDNFRLYGYRGDTPIMTPLTPESLVGSWDGIYAERKTLPHVC